MNTAIYLTIIIGTVLLIAQLERSEEQARQWKAASEQWKTASEKWETAAKKWQRNADDYRQILFSIRPDFKEAAQ